MYIYINIFIYIYFIYLFTYIYNIYIYIYIYIKKKKTLLRVKFPSEVLAFGAYVFEIYIRTYKYIVTYVICNIGLIDLSSDNDLIAIHSSLERLEHLLGSSGILKI